MNIINKVGVWWYITKNRGALVKVWVLIQLVGLILLIAFIMWFLGLVVEY